MKKPLHMEQRIKDFDRNIESKMNNNEVAPPFGMWNRIAADLDNYKAVPIAVVAMAAPVALISRRMIIGFVSGAAIIGASLITAYFVGNKSKITIQKSVNNNQVSPSSQTTTSSLVTTSSSIVPVTITLAPIQLVSRKSATVITASATSIKLVSSKIKQTATENILAMDKTIVAANEIAIPDNVSDASTNMVTELYYFPGVDVETSVTKSEIAKVVNSETKKVSVIEKPVEKRKVSSSYGEHRIKIKKQRKGGYTYGTLNRLNKHRGR